MKYILRDYQARDVERLRAAFAAGFTAPLYVLPTAGGKTVVFCHIAESAAALGRRILILVHRKELLEQASQKLFDLNMPHGLIAPSRTMTKDLIQVASVDTLIRRLDRVKRPDLTIVDEAHHCIPGNKWGRVVSFYRNRILGVTATPIRMQGAGLGRAAGGYFDNLVCGPSISELISLGYLSAPIIYAPPVKVDLRGIRMRHGDYDQSELSFRMDKDVITGDAVSHYKRICPGAPAIAFCASLKHAEHVADKFRQEGISADFIHGEMSDSQREYRIKSLGNGQIKVLTSCEIISEGTDIPVVTTAILLRPTQSIGLFIQQCGRTLRIHPGKKCSYILDHVNNSARHGLIDENRNWNLDAHQKQKGDKEEVIRISQCPKCYAAYPPYRPRCPLCGFIRPKQEREYEEVAGELEPIQREAFNQEIERRRRLSERAACDSFEALERLAAQRGYKPGWAAHVWRSRQERRFNKKPETAGAF